MRLRTAAIAGLLVLAGRAGAAPPVITNPAWIKKPDANAYSRYYPPLATALGLSGYAVIHCLVAADGLLSNCRSDVDRPDAVGFGRAAIAMSAEFRMQPQTLNGQPVAGSGINIPIRFTAPPDEPATEPPAPLSEDAAKQAYRVVDASKAVDRGLDGFETTAKRIEGMGADRAVARAGADAFRRASQAHREELRTAYARAFASIFNEAELASIADYNLASGDQKQAASAFVAGQTQISNEYRRNLATLAHAAFCAKAACGPPSDVQRVWRAADPRDTSRVDNPQWVSQPTASALTRAQPRLAGVLGLNGVVRLTCKVADKGDLTDCAVDEEAPAGLGYGAAALQVTQAYRLNPIQLAAGAAGKRTTVRVGFPAAPQGEPVRVKPGSAHAVDLARQIGETDQVAQASRLETELQATDFATNAPKSADPKIYDIAVDAYRAGAQQALADYLEQSIDNLSAAFSEEQLQMRADFRATPGGKVEQSRSKELTVALTGAQTFVWRKVISDARDDFCRARDCSIPPRPAQPQSAVSSAPSTPKP